MSLPPAVPQLPPRLVDGATVLADRDAILPLLPKGAVICEVGVGVGTFSRRMIEICEPRHFIAIDNFRIHELAEFWGQPIHHWFGDKTHHAFYRDCFVTETESGRMTVLQAESDTGIGQLEDASVDVFYIDADHGYEAVRRDLAVAVRKVRPDGFIIMNDYVLVDQLGAQAPYGVIYATNEFMIEYDWAMRFLALQTNMYCDVVLRRAGLAASGRQSAGQRNDTHERDAGLQVRNAPLIVSPRAEPPTKADRETMRLNIENAALRREIAGLRASSSWRITAPLRAFKERIRQIR